MKLKISILGSTGSIGSTALKIINKKKKIFIVNLLSANKNIRLISKQIKKYNPKVFVVTNKKVFLKIKNKFKKSKTKIFNDFNNKSFLKSHITISSIPGIAGLKPTISMI